MSLTIVIPAYNEQQSLEILLPEVITHCTSKGYQLIITNDGSTDLTRSVLDAHIDSSCLTTIHHKVNRGYGGAIKSGIIASNSTYVISIDADGQHMLQDVDKLFGLIVSKDADMIVGNRDANKQSLYRQTGKGVIRIIAKLLMPLPIKDINSGMKIYRTDLAKRYLKLCPDSMAYSDTIALAFINERHLVLEEPISIKPRTGGESTINTRTALETIMEILNIVVLFNPMRIFLPAAIIFLLSGIAWGIPIFARGDGISVGSMLLIVSGLLFFLLGLVAEMLSTIRKNQIHS